MRNWWRCLGLVILLSFLPVFSTPIGLAAEILTNDSVVTMVKAGLGDELIISKVKISQGQFDLSTNGILKLKSDGVSDAIVRAMVEASASPPAPAAKTADAVAKETQGAIALYRHGKGAEAVAAFDKLLVDLPYDVTLRIWKARALLEQARALKDVHASGYKPLVVSAYGILQPMGRAQAHNPDWNFAMAQAFWLNDRPTWAGKAASKALELRPDFVEAQIVVGDLTYDSEFSAINAPATDPRREAGRRFAGESSRKEYHKALAMPNAPASVRAEALYKLGLVAAELEGKKTTAGEYWERAVAAEPACRYGTLAQQKLRTVGGK
jgi:tetratricopeptide (TPR) repeat protein